MLSGVRPPEICCLLLSLSVRSGLISRQLFPPSVVTCTCWLPTYTLLWSWGEMVSGASQTNRYLSSAAGQPPVLTGQISTWCACRVRRSIRVTIPPNEPEPEALDQTTSGSSGSGVAQPLSPPATENHSERAIVPPPPKPPVRLLLGTRYEGPSCRLPY